MALTYFWKILFSLISEDLSLNWLVLLEYIILYNSVDFSLLQILSKAIWIQFQNITKEFVITSQHWIDKMLKKMN